MKENVVFNWSGGKDSSLALYYLLQDERFSILRFLTSVSKDFQRVSMHGVRVSLLEKQAESLGILLQKIEIPEGVSMEAYDEIMGDALQEIQQLGCTSAAFGDIFLEDLKQYRENRLAKLQMKGIFPLWKRDTREIVNEFIQLGFKSVVTCVNEKYLDSSFVGRTIDASFLADLPPNVDPCGENGEYHSFVFDGPIFKQEISYQLGEKIHRTYQTKEDEFGFWFCDLLDA
ncbi:MAG TPA: diphthine--ammonia ligase [Fluviicola sp.]|nr:diphthine--ammonia ligase [Fluviicola sp.]